jgi:hypothetical protein
MKWVGSGEQQRYDYLYRADGAIATGGTAQIVLGRSMSRSHLFFQNLSSGALYLEIGTGAATATITNGAVSSVAVTNVGFGFSKPPLVRFFGGGNAFGNTSYTGLSQPGGPAPNSVASLAGSSQPTGVVAKAHCVMTGSAPNMSISSIVLDQSDGGGEHHGGAPIGGKGYVIAPYVAIINSDLDPNGAAVPSLGVGFLIQPGGGNLYYNGTTCPTDPVAVWGATTSQAYLCRWLS